jgi:hypothetical protein
MEGFSATREGSPQRREFRGILVFQGLLWYKVSYT